MERRDLLRWLAGAIAAPSAARPLEWDAIGRTLHAEAQTAPVAATRALTEAHSRTLSAMCEGLIPDDDTPGAIAAGVPAFIDRVLADWCAPAERQLAIDALSALDDHTRAAGAASFASATPAQQTRALEAFDAEYSQWRRAPQPPALPGVQAIPLHPFGLLKTLTIWGYFTSEAGQRQELGTYPPPVGFNGCAPYEPRRGRRPAAAPQVK
jgi:gluconate 2-dehydrogenase gamma chain